MKTSNSPTSTFPSLDEDVSLLLQEAASIGMWEFNVGGEKVHWSAGTKKLHGVSCDFEPTVMQAIKFYKEGFYRDKVQRDFENAIINAQKFDGHYIIITACGKEKWVRSVGVPVVENGACTKIYGIFQDIDSQKKAQLELKQKEQKFRKTFLNAPNGVALISLKGEWMQFNPQVSKIFGYTVDEISALRLRDLNYPGDLAINIILKDKLLSGDTENYQAERRFVHKTGKTIWALISVSLVRSEMSSPDYYICQITDITSLKNANHQIEDLLSKTEGQNEKLLNFKHIVSHNLRSHTSNLDMLLTFLKQDIPKIEESSVFQMLENAFGNLEETIENLSEVSSFENVTSDDFVEINVVQIIDKTLTSLNTLFHEVCGTVTVSVSPQLRVMAIPEYLRSIFLNILSNTIKYRRENEPLKVVVSATQDDNYTIIHFTDNGLGIDLDLHGSKIFGLYKTFHRNESSRGLGLYIVKNQIEALGGCVQVDSTVGKGSTFKIYLKR
ncbi:PAS domain S-box protein [uncultured Dokdonia sp.]|uniref:sensor histidine kinase n=1 Tax=Dokdonia sp. R78006 TaxID=3093866 RepID=UPI002623918E|nr:sensor histidine kinase [uncultured Dokdonia sp.]